MMFDHISKLITEMSLSERRAKLQEFIHDLPVKNLPAEGVLRLSPASHDRDQAENWMRELGAIGLDGIIAKRLDEPYRSGKRTAMVKIKRIRTADCVVGGFRYAEKGGGIGSRLLGLYNEQGQLEHGRFTSSFNAKQRRELKKIVKPLIGAPGFP